MSEDKVPLMKVWLRGLGRHTFFVTRKILSVMPYPIFRAVRWFFVAIGHLVMAKKRKVALENLKVAFGDEMTEEQRKKIADECFKLFGEGMINLTYLLDRPKLIAESVSIRGEEHLSAALAKGNGAIFVGAHFGNFILMYIYLAQMGYKPNVIMKRTRDKEFEEYISNFRNERGIQTIYDLPPRQCVQGCIKALRRNEILIILLDQNYGGDGRVFVDFFGRPAATATGPAVFAKRTGAPILPIFMRHKEENSHVLDILPPYDLVVAEDEEITMKKNIQALTKIIEEQIRQHPHEWGGWMHKRWKSLTREEQSKVDRLREQGHDAGVLYEH